VTGSHNYYTRKEFHSVETTVIKIKYCGGVYMAVVVTSHSRIKTKKYFEFKPNVQSYYITTVLNFQRIM